MKKSDFYYDLPDELIAQTPLENRSDSRLMLLDRRTGEYSFKRFYDIGGLLRPGDLLVLNDSRVIPARLFGVREGTSSAVEVVLLHQSASSGSSTVAGQPGRTVWECLVRPGKRCRPGDRLVFGGNGESGESGDAMSAEILEILEGGNRLIRFEHSGIFLEQLERLGKMPLPPYIKETLSDPERYQTVYSKNPGSAAAPTAGLHFTDELLDSLQRSGIATEFVTLHVGLGTFRPVKEENVLDHHMHSEFCVLPASVSRAVSETKRAGGRVIAVGTTSLRTLEAFYDGTDSEKSGWTDIFIYPGYEFRAVDALITNFHLPESTLLMLVSALAGRENILRAYSAAIAERFRFFSFGDAMFIY